MIIDFLSMMLFLIFIVFYVIMHLIYFYDLFFLQIMFISLNVIIFDYLAIIVTFSIKIIYLCT
jgi:hypothetical protein